MADVKKTEGTLDSEGAATKRKKRTRSLVALGVTAALAASGAGIWAVYYRGRVRSDGAVGYVDGRIETGENAVDSATKAAAEAKPAKIVGDDPEGDLSAVVFVGLTGDSKADAGLVSYLKDSGIKATFALSASDALENAQTLEAIIDAGFGVVSNGASGEDNLHTLATRDVVKTMLRSRESLSGAVNKPVSLMSCSGTRLTGDVLRAASASGYEALVQASDAHVLDEGSFTASGDADAYVASLTGQSVTLYDLRGPAAEASDEDAVSAEAPAIDKQPGLDDTQDAEEIEEVPDAVKQAEWLADAFKSSGKKTALLGELKSQDGYAELKAEACSATAELSPVYRYCLTSKNEVGIGCKGLPAHNDVAPAVKYLQEKSWGATYFLAPGEAEGRDDDLSSLSDAGADFGLRLAPSDVAGRTAGQVFDVLYKDVMALQALPGATKAVLLDGDFPDGELASVRAAAKQLNLKLVDPEDSVDLAAGSFRMIGGLEVASVSKLVKELEGTGLDVVSIAGAIKDSGTIPSLTANALTTMRQANDHKLAEATNLVHTTERSCSFAFYGMGREAVVEDVVDRLAAHGDKGTFFVSLDELMSCQRAIEYVLAHGDEIGIYYRESSDYPLGFGSVATYVNSWKKYAAWRYGVDSDVVFTSGDVNDAMEEAVSASGCELVKNTFRIVRDEDKDIDLGGIQTALDEVSKLRVMRGSFVCFNMSFYANDADAAKGQTILGSLLDGFISQHIDSLAFTNHDGQIEDASRFKVTTASEVLAAPRYEFCDGEQTDIALDKNVLTSMPSDAERFQRICEGYYGNVTVNVSDKLPGFSDEEISQLDKVGTFTSDKVLFLTFDDWGTEQSINELLYVLQKHGVKGTFFVKTEYVDANPNLLRTIAEQGHQIADHTDGHIPLADEDPTNENKTYSLTDEEAAKTRQDLVTSYNKLYKYTGNVFVDGRAALSRMFRPPTLAVSKIGLEQVFDVGYEYSISGNYSTGDYEASSYDDMIERLTKRSVGQNEYVTVENGTVLVMHMQENAKYTAQALDTMIPVWQAQGYTFARVDDYLGKQGGTR